MPNCYENFITLSFNVWAHVVMKKLKQKVHKSAPSTDHTVCNAVLEDRSCEDCFWTHLCPGVFMTTTTSSFPSFNHMCGRCYRHLPHIPLCSPFLCTQLQAPVSHAWGLSLAIQQAGSARGLILPGNIPQQLTAGSW